MTNAFILFLSIISFPVLADTKSAPWVGNDFNGYPCTGREQGYGPFDYVAERNKLASGSSETALHLVERAHFPIEYENLIIPPAEKAVALGGFDYTIRAWPNHHRALLSLAKYQIDVAKKIREPVTISPIECYFQRAFRFSPKDAAPHAIFAYYLSKVDKLEQAEKQYQVALELNPGSSKIEYSYSLFLIELKKYDMALEYAKKSYIHGNPPKALKNRLTKLGVWKD